MEIALSHNNMDFDSLSAQFALTKLYPSCRMILGYPLTGNVRTFLALNRSYLPISQIKYLDTSKISRFFLVDCQHLERLDIGVQKLLLASPSASPALSSFNLPRLSRPLTIFDHHDSDEHGLLSSATADSIIEKVGSATTILVDLIIKAGTALSPFDATLLAIGIFEDTGCLTYSGTTAKDAQCVSFLIEKGADLSVVREYIKPRLEQQQVALFERLLSQTEIIETHGHRFALSIAEEASYIEGLATITRQLLDVNNVDGAFTISHMRDRVHIVGRCDPKAISARDVVRQFGGDGHAGAASAVVKGGNVREIKSRLKAVIERFVVHQPVAADLMDSPVRTVRSDISMDEAGRIMLRYGVDGLVVADGEKLAGIISRRDIDQSSHHKLGHARVSGFMSKPVITATLETTLDQIQQTMVAEDIGRLPILDQSGQLVGLVSRQNVLNSMFGEGYARDKIGGLSANELNDESKDDFENVIEDTKIVNLAVPIRRLDADTVWLAEEIGRLAAAQGMVSYAVGGFVRDLLLKVPTFDLDFVIEGSAGDLADQLVLKHPDKFELLAKHERFQTATLVYYTAPPGVLNASGRRPHRDVDLSTARIEIYEKPAALPLVEPSKLEHDLQRRDFTINALAVCLNPQSFGKLIDHFNGRRDLAQKNIRILHPFSFIEDPTRIVRAARFAGRLNFHLHAKTKEQARRAIAMGIFDDLGGVRIKEELRLILTSPNRLKSLKILAELSPKLSYLDSQLVFCEATSKAIRRAERLIDRYPLDEAWIVYLGALLSELHIDRVTGILERLQLTNKQKEIVESGLELHRHMPLELSDLKRSQIYELMHYRPREALAIAAAIATVGSDLRRAIKIYMDELAGAKLVINGADLIAIGHKPGPALGEALRVVMAARLDRKLVSREEQLSCASDFLNEM